MSGKFFKVFLAAVAALALNSCSKNDSDDGMTFTVRRSGFPITVVESGNVEAAVSNNIVQKINKTVKILSIVEEGTTLTEQDVADGRIIVQFESRDFEDLVYDRQTAFENADASVVKAEEDLAIQLSTNESSIRSAELNVIYAENDLKKLVGEELAELYATKMPEDIGKLLEDKRLGGQALLDLVTYKSDIELAQIKLNRAVQTLEFTQKLYDKQFVSKNELETDALDVESQKKALQTTKGKYEIFLAYDFIKDFYKAQSTLLESRDTLDRTRAQARSKQVSAESTLRTARQTLARATKRLEESKADLELCTIRATSPGLVVYEPQPQWSNSGPIQAGSEIRQGQVVIQLPDLSKMVVKVRIHESQIDTVEVGQRAQVTIDAMPGQVFMGTVTRKSFLPDSQRRWMNEGVKVYATEITLDETSDNLRPGMNATAEITAERVENVLYVPCQSVYTDEKEHHFCYLAEEKRPVLVTLGRRNRVFVEITSGLSANDVILMNPPEFSTEKNEDKADKAEDGEADGE